MAACPKCTSRDVIAGVEVDSMLCCDCGNRWLLRTKPKPKPGHRPSKKSKRRDKRR